MSRDEPNPVDIVGFVADRDLAAARAALPDRPTATTTFDVDALVDPDRFLHPDAMADADPADAAAIGLALAARSFVEAGGSMRMMETIMAAVAERYGRCPGTTWTRWENGWVSRCDACNFEARDDRPGYVGQRAAQKAGVAHDRPVLL